MGIADFWKKKKKSEGSGKASSADLSEKSVFRGDLALLSESPRTISAPVKADARTASGHTDQTLEKRGTVTPVPSHREKIKVPGPDSEDCVLFMNFPKVMSDGWSCVECGVRNEENYSGCVVCGRERQEG